VTISVLGLIDFLNFYHAHHGQGDETFFFLIWKSEHRLYVLEEGVLLSVDWWNCKNIVLIQAFFQVNKFSVCTWPAGILATGQKQLFFALHYAFLNKLPKGYSEEHCTFACDPEASLPVDKHWKDWSPILPMCVMSGVVTNPTTVWQDIKHLWENSSSAEVVRLVSFLYRMCDPKGLMKLGLQKPSGFEIMTENSILMLAGAHTLNQLLPTSEGSLEESQRVRFRSIFEGFLCQRCFCLFPGDWTKWCTVIEATLLTDHENMM
jgi:hypothetical protein